MPTGHAPTVRHRRLAAELRRLRESVGLRQEQAATALGWSRPKLVKLETARTAPSVADVVTLLELYDAPEKYRTALIRLCRDLRKRGWWTAYDDVLPTSFAELEDDAVEIRSWQVQEVPALLQTDDYALAAIRLSNPEDGEEAHLRRLQARMARRTVLTRHAAPTLHVVLDESALRRSIGGPGALRKQLIALLEAMERPNIHLQVAPFDQGCSPGIDGSFVVLSFGGPIVMDVAYFKSTAGHIYVDDVERVRRCCGTFKRISETALTEADSATLIESLIDE